MLIFGHAGIALGAAALAAGTFDRRSTANFPLSSFASLSRYADIRLFVLGSLLPDIIDKPVGQYLFRETFFNGRIFAHALLFLVLAAAAGYYLYRRGGQRWLLTIAAGTFSHLVLDEMWQAPATLFWPVFGFTFARAALEDWALNILLALFSEPAVYIPEAIGLAIILWFGLTLVLRKGVGGFIKHGKMP